MEREDKYLLVKISIIVVCIVIIALVLLTPFFFDFAWNQALRDTLPESQYFFRYITEFGGTLIYLGIFFTIFWGINKNFAKSLLFIYVASNFANYYAKAIIAKDRPPESSWLLIGASHLSTPSGHAMSSTVFWGFSSMKIKRFEMWILSISIIILVGLSRLYLGVHWFGDVLTGWLFGLIILIIVLSLEDNIRTFIAKFNITYIYLGLAVLGLVVMILTEIFYESSYNFGTPGGQLIGLGLGFALEHKYVNFKIDHDPGERGKLILRVLIGILLISIIFLGLYLIIDSSVFWMSALQYIITLVIGIFVWPYIFKKFDF